MSKTNLHKNLAAKALLAVIALLVFTEPAWAVLGVWRRAAVTTAVVTTSVATSEAAAANANASKQEAAAQQAAAASAQQAAAASAASAASAQQAAAATQVTQKSPQQKLKELQSLYDQKLISQADYQAAKTKILNGL
jgi:type IV secretory pathway TrbL component